MPRWYKLLGVVQLWAPDARSHQLLADLTNELIAEGAEEIDVESFLISVLNTGVTTNRWPWS